MTPIWFYFSAYPLGKYLFKTHFLHDFSSQNFHFWRKKGIFVQYWSTIDDLGRKGIFLFKYVAICGKICLYVIPLVSERVRYLTFLTTVKAIKRLQHFLLDKLLRALINTHLIRNVFKSSILIFMGWWFPGVLIF